MLGTAYPGKPKGTGHLIDWGVLALFENTKGVDDPDSAMRYFVKETLLHPSQPVVPRPNGNYQYVANWQYNGIVEGVFEHFDFKVTVAVTPGGQVYTTYPSGSIPKYPSK